VALRFLEQNRKTTAEKHCHCLSVLQKAAAQLFKTRFRLSLQLKQWRILIVRCPLHYSIPFFETIKSTFATGQSSRPLSGAEGLPIAYKSLR